MKQRKRFEIIECSGTSYEIGRQYGKAARKNIIKSIDALINRISFGQKSVKEEVLANTRKYIPLVESFDPELIEMLKGQAEGSSVSFDEVFALRCWFELRFYYQRLTAMCTSFAVTGKATRGGKTIVGESFDVMPGITLDLVRKKHKDGMKQLSLVFWGGGELTLTSAGLAVVLNVVLTPAEEQRLNIPCCCVMPKAMRQKRIGDALEVFCSSGRSMLHYALASKEGEIFSIETKPDDFSVIQPVNDFLVHTNHFLTDRFKVGDSRIPEIRGSTYVRQQRLHRLIDKYYGDLTVERMMEFMSDHHNYPHSICGHPNEEMLPSFRSETVATIIMVPEDGLMYVTDGQPCQNEFEEYQL